jgi:hypothetical protein
LGSDKRTLASVVGRVALLACLLVGIACSGDGQSDGDNDAGGDDDSSASDDESGGSNGEEAVATDAETVRPYVEELLVHYDVVVNQIVADPDVAGNADDPLVHEYLDLYEPGGDTARQLVDVWADRAADGLSTRPIEPDQPASLTRLDGGIEVRSDHEVAFPACIELQLEVVDGEGRVTQCTPYRRPPTPR